MSKTMNEAGIQCPSAEQLACLSEGTLHERDRSGLIAHLLACPVCYEVAAETMQIRLLLPEQAEKEAVSKGKAFVWVRWGLAVAAVVLLALVLSLREKQIPQIQPGTIAKPAPESVPLQPGSALPEQPAIAPPQEVALRHDFLVSLARFSGNAVVAESSVTETYAFGTATSQRKVAFLAGIELASLEMILLKNDAARLARSAERVAARLEQIGESPELVSIYRGESQKLIAGSYHRLEAAFAHRGLETELKWGEWLQSATMAARARQTDFFRSEDCAYFAQALPVADLPRGIGRNLELFDEWIKRGEITGRSWEKLEGLIRDTIELTALSL